MNAGITSDGITNDGITTIIIAITTITDAIDGGRRSWAFAIGVGPAKSKDLPALCFVAAGWMKLAFMQFGLSLAIFDAM